VKSNAQLFRNSRLLARQILERVSRSHNGCLAASGVIPHSALRCQEAKTSAVTVRAGTDSPVTNLSHALIVATASRLDTGNSSANVLQNSGSAASRSLTNIGFGCRAQPEITVLP